MCNVQAALYKYELGLRSLEDEIDDENREEYEEVLRLVTKLRKSHTPEQFFGKEEM